MKSSKKCAKAGEVEIFNTEVIYSRVMCLLRIGKIELEEVLNYELSPALIFLIWNVSSIDLQGSFVYYVRIDRRREAVA